MTNKFIAVCLGLMMAVALFAAYSKVYAIEPPEPKCLDVDPSYYLVGEGSTHITVTGKNTSFTDLTTVDFGCPSVIEDTHVLYMLTRITTY